MFTLALQIVHLSADHAAHRSGRDGQFFDQPGLRLRLALHLRQHLKSQRQQCVARQDRDRLAEYFVAGRPAATQIVVVERGKIVVNQRISVNQLQRAGGRLDPGRRIRNSLRRRHAQDGTNALAAREEAIPHGFVNGLRRRGFGWHPALECLIYPTLLLRYILRQRHAWSSASVMLCRTGTVPAEPCRLSGPASRSVSRPLPTAFGSFRSAASPSHTTPARAPAAERRPPVP